MTAGRRVAVAFVRVAVVGAGVVAAAAGLAGCGTDRRPPSPAVAALIREARPIGRGARFESGVRGPVLGPCRHRLGPRTRTHVEIFARNRVVLIPAGIGTRRPVHTVAGRIAGARCFGRVVTTDPTGVVLVRSGERVLLAALFRSWGVSLSRVALAGFRAPAGSTVRVYVDGRRRDLAPTRVSLVPGAEIVLEVGPVVAPHRSYTFAPGP